MGINTDIVADKNVKAPTPSIVEITIIIDAEALIKNGNTGGSIDMPKSLKDQDAYVYMIASKSEVVTGIGTAELKVKMQTNQSIQFTNQPLQPIEYSVLLRRCKVTTGDNYISVPTCYAVQKTQMVMDPNKRPPQDNIVSNILFISRWSMEALKAGGVTYTFTFEVWDNSKLDNSGRPTSLGCFSWDPHIQITL